MVNDVLAHTRRFDARERPYFELLEARGWALGVAASDARANAHVVVAARARARCRSHVDQ